MDFSRLGAWGRNITDGNRQRDEASIDPQKMTRMTGRSSQGIWQRREKGVDGVCTAAQDV